MSSQPDPQLLADATAAVALDMQHANRRVNHAANRLAEVCSTMSTEFHGAIVELLEALGGVHELASALAVASADPAPPTVPLPGDH